MTRNRYRAVGQLIAAISLAVAVSACGASGHPAQVAVNPGPAPVSGSASPAGSGPASPAAGSTAASTTVPNVDSEPLLDAEQALQQAGLVIGTLAQEPNLSIGSMSVISTDPAAGSAEPVGSAVNLVVSSGPYGCRGCRLIPPSTRPPVLAPRVDPSV